MIKKTKAIEQIERHMEGLDQGSFRYEVLACAKQFKTYWIELGRYLYTIWKDKLYKEWEYISFEAYCAKEIGIKHTTASKLLKSYYFLEKEEPEFLKPEYIEAHRPNDLPSLESVNLLRLARANKNLDEADYRTLRAKALERPHNVSDLRQTFRNFVESAQGIDPEEIHRKRRIANLRRLITLLRQVTKEAEFADMLPKSVLSEAARLVEKLEAEIER